MRSLDQYMRRFVWPFFVSTILILGVSSGAFAQVPAAPPVQPTFGEILFKMLPMFVIVFVVFHFFIIRPQRRKEQEHAALLKGLKNGDNVITTSGMFGRVAGVSPEFVTLEISSGVKIKILPSHITGPEPSKKVEQK